MADHLVSLKRNKKDRKNSEHAVDIGDGSDFPFGTSITLDDETLTKLGMTKLPPVGEMLIVAAIGRVESVSERSDSNRKTRNVSVQLEQMAIGPLKAGGPKTSEDAISDAIEDL